MADPVLPPRALPRDPLLAVRDLRIGFRAGAGARPGVESRTAVGGISLAVPPGQVLALVGESGSGKSVTALSLLGLLPATARVSGSAVLSSAVLSSAVLGGGSRSGGAAGGGIELIGAAPATLRSVRGSRIGAVFQDPFTAFNPVMRIGTQIAEALGAHAKAGAEKPPHRC